MLDAGNQEHYGPAPLDVIDGYNEDLAHQIATQVRQTIMGLPPQVALTSGLKGIVLGVEAVLYDLYRMGLRRPSAWGFYWSFLGEIARLQDGFQFLYSRDKRRPEVAARHMQ